jgi:Fic/DOC family
VAAAVAAAARSPGVPSALAAARDGIDSLLRDRGLRRTTPELTAESLRRGALASARLARASTDGETPDRFDAVTEGTLRLYGELLGLVPVVRRAPLQALARMHALVAVDEPPERRGRPRGSPDSVPRLHEAAALMTTQADVPALALAACAHAEIAVIAPFETGSMRIGRALERLLLVARGVDPGSLTVPEAGHAASAEGYRAALQAYGTGGPDGKRIWLLHAAQALNEAAAASPVAD